jgi:hypothetical protein
MFVHLSPLKERSMISDDADRAVLCWSRALEKYARANASGVFEQRDQGVLRVVTGKISVANGVFSVDREANADAVAAAAQVATEDGVPWSIQIREADPPAAIIRVAEAHGLGTWAPQPLMIKTLDPSVAEADGRKLATVDLAGGERDFPQGHGRGFWRAGRRGEL